MTFAELNEVRRLKKKLADENKKLVALKIVIGAFPHKYGKSDGGGSGTVATKSAFESFIVQIADCEKEIESLQAQLNDAVPRLTKKIQDEISDSAEQTLLIYRYVACKYFRDIGFLMGYSERRVYQLHEQIVKRFQSIAVDFS